MVSAAVIKDRVSFTPFHFALSGLVASFAHTTIHCLTAERMMRTKTDPVAMLARLLRLFTLQQLFLGFHDVCGTEIRFDGDENLSHVISPLPHTYMDPTQLPKNFFWGNVGGRSYLTHMLNQHIPQCKRGKQWVMSYFIVHRTQQQLSSLTDRSHRFLDFF